MLCLSVFFRLVTVFLVFALPHVVVVDAQGCVLCSTSYCPNVPIWMPQVMEGEDDVSCVEIDQMQLTPQGVSDTGTCKEDVQQLLCSFALERSRAHNATDCSDGAKLQCQEDCDFVFGCMSTLGQTFLDCDAITASDAQCINVDGTEYNAAVWDSRPPVGPPLPATCSYPFVAAEGTDPDNVVGVNGNGEQCAVPCPAPLYTVQEYDDLLYGQIVLNSISFVLALATLIPYARVPELRRKGLQIAFVGIATSITTMYIVGLFSLLSFEDTNLVPHVNCANNSEIAKPGKSVFCGIQGFLNQFLLLSMTMIWFYTGVSALMQVKFGRTKFYLKWIQPRKNWVWVVLSLSTAMLLSVVPLIFTEYGGSNNPIQSCFFYDPTPVWCLWVFFYGPSVVCIVINNVIIIIFIRDMRRAAIKHSSTNQGTKARSTVNLRLIAFLSIFDVLYGISVIMRIWIDIKTDDWVDSTTTFVECWLPGGAQDADVCGLVPADRLSIGASWTYVFLASTVGLVIGVLYFSQPLVYRWWFTCGKEVGTKTTLGASRRGGPNSSRFHQQKSSLRSNRSRISSALSPTTSKHDGIVSNVAAGTSTTMGSVLPGQTTHDNVTSVFPNDVEEEDLAAMNDLHLLRSDDEDFATTAAAVTINTSQEHVEDEKSNKQQEEV